MRVGLLSDIHGNLEALTQVLDACDRHQLDKILCLGDVVGYGADPARCLALIVERATVVCGGNHDWAVAARIDTEHFNGMASDAVSFSQEQLSEADLQTLRDLPPTERDGDVLFVHGSPHEPEAFHYLFSASDAAYALTKTDARLVFVRHSHRAFVYSEDDGEVMTGEGRTDVAEGRFLVNVGSVGQPRYGDPRAAFCVWDSDQGTVELIRIGYDVTVAQSKIREQGLHEFLAQRLSSGR